MVIGTKSGAKFQVLQIDGARPSLEIDVAKQARSFLYLRIASTKPLDHTLTIRLAAQSHLSLVILSEASNKSQKLSQHMHIGANASLDLTCVTLGSDVTHDLEARAEGVNAESVIRWVAYARDGEKQDLTLASRFLAKRTHGSVAMRGVTEGRSTLVCRGKVEVGKRASQADATLSQRLLMLDPHSSAEAIPALEVRTNDVRASHSATVTKIDESDLFYLTSRGLPRAEARKLCIDGFLEEFLSAIPDREIRRHILKALLAKKEGRKSRA